MKKFLFIIIIIIYCSCDSNTGNQKIPVDDSGNVDISPAMREHMVDSMVNRTLRDAYLKDTLGIDNAPVKIMSSRPVEKEYSSYKDIHLSWKNTSDKTISAIKFSWYGLNAFGDPADMGALADGFGAGFTDNTLKPGKTDAGTWSILSRDLKKVVKAWPTEVVFEDGTKWKSKQ